MNRLDELNANVATAIRKVEEAQTGLAHAELAIVTATSPTSVEGRIARRGVIRAAREANLDDWVEKLLETFLAEDGTDAKLNTELKVLACPEPRGKWYLVYSWSNSYEKGAIEDKEISLEATTEVEAIAEGSVRWARELAEANANWEKQKATWVHPPVNAFDGATPHPRIIYRISL